MHVPKDDADLAKATISGMTPAQASLVLLGRPGRPDATVNGFDQHSILVAQ